MDSREKAHNLLERIHIARRDAMREYRKIDRIQISKEAELVLIAGQSDVMLHPSHDAPSVMGIPIERVHEGPEFKLVFK